MDCTHLLDSSCAFSSPPLIQCWHIVSLSWLCVRWVRGSGVCFLLSLPSFTSLTVYCYPGGSPCLKIPSCLRFCASTTHTHTAAYLEGNPTVPPHPSRHSSALHPTTFSLTVPCLPLLPQIPLSVSSFLEPY